MTMSLPKQALKVQAIALEGKNIILKILPPFIKENEAPALMYWPLQNLPQPFHLHDTFILELKTISNSHAENFPQEKNVQKPGQKINISNHDSEETVRKLLETLIN